MYSQAQYENKISNLTNDLESAQLKVKEAGELNNKINEQHQRQQIDCEKRIWDMDLEGKSLQAQLESKNIQVRQLEDSIEKCKKDHQDELKKVHARIDTEADMLKEQHRKQLADLEAWASDLELEKTRTQDECRAQVGRNERQIESLEEEIIRVKEQNVKAEKDVKAASDAVIRTK